MGLFKKVPISTLEASLLLSKLLTIARVLCWCPKNTASRQFLSNSDCSSTYILLLFIFFNHHPFPWCGLPRVCLSFVFNRIRQSEVVPVVILESASVTLAKILARDSTMLLVSLPPEILNWIIQLVSFTDVPV